MADRPSAAGGISRNVDTIIRDAVATVWTSAPVPPPGGRVTGRTPAGFEPGIVVPFFMGLVGSSSGFVSIAGDKRCWRIEEAGREGALPCSAGGAASRIRTEDLSFTKALLYHCAKAAGNGAGGYETAARPLSYVGLVSNIADDFGQTCCLVWRVNMIPGSSGWHNAEQLMTVEVVACCWRQLHPDRQNRDPSTATKLVSCPDEHP